MKGPKPKAPKETRLELEKEIRDRLDSVAPGDVIGYLLQFFTNVDMVGIRDQLRRDNGL